MFKLTRGGLIKDDDLRRRHQPHPSPWAQDHGRSGRSCLGPNSRSLTCFRLNILIMIVDATVNHCELSSLPCSWSRWMTLITVSMSIQDWWSRSPLRTPMLLQLFTTRFPPPILTSSQTITSNASRWRNGEVCGIHLRSNDFFFYIPKSTQNFISSFDSIIFSMVYNSDSRIITAALQFTFHAAT